MFINNKEYILKIYRPGVSGAFIKALYDFNWSGSIRKQINGGLGGFTFNLPNTFDNYGQGDLINHNNQIKLYCKDIDSSPNGILIYSGFIYNTEVSIKGTSESVIVNCYGNISKLAASILKSGTYIILYTTAAGINYTGAGASCEIATVFKAIIDRYRAESTNDYINYGASTVDTTGNSLYYTFDKLMIAEALDVCKEACPDGWYWYIDENDIIYLKAKPTTPIHTFVLGRDFTEVNILDNSDTVVNNVIFQSKNDSGDILTI